MRDGMEILVRTIDPPAGKPGVPLRYALVRPGGSYGFMVAAFAMKDGELLEWNYPFPLQHEVESFGETSSRAIMERARLKCMPLADFPDPPPGWTTSENVGLCDVWRGSDPALIFALRLLLLNEEEADPMTIQR